MTVMLILFSEDFRFEFMAKAKTKSRSFVTGKLEYSTDPTKNRGL